MFFKLNVFLQKFEKVLFHFAGLFLFLIPQNARCSPPIVFLDVGFEQPIIFRLVYPWQKIGGFKKIQGSEKHALPYQWMDVSIRVWVVVGDLHTYGDKLVTFRDEPPFS